MDAASLELEKKMKEDVFDPAHDRLQESAAAATVNINVARGYDDIAAVTIIGDAMMMPLGFMIVFVYVMVMLGRFNCVETRVLRQLSQLPRVLSSDLSFPRLSWLLWVAPPLV